MKLHVAKICVLALCVILTGCDSTQFFYNRANWLLSYQADRYFDLNKIQTTSVNQAINHWLSWHRRTQLTCYAELIGQFETRARTDLTGADVTWLEAELKGHYETVITSAAAPAAHVLSSLDTDQINHLEKRLAKDHRKLARQLRFSHERRLHRRAKKTVAGVEKWFGNLSRAQVAWIKKRSKALPDTYAPWLQYRKQRDSTLIELLRENVDAETIAHALKPMWITMELPSKSDDDTANKTEILMAEMMSQSKALAVDFYGLASTEQKAHFWHRLHDYRGDFLQLASVAPSGASCEMPTILLTEAQTGLSASR